MLAAQSDFILYNYEINGVAVFDLILNLILLRELKNDKEKGKSFRMGY